MADQVSQLRRALDATGVLVDGVRDDQWDDTTPCPDWRVRDLLGHLVAGNGYFAAAVRGQPPPGPPGTEPAELRTGYRATAGELLAAFGEPGALDRVVRVPFGAVPGTVAVHLRVTELLVHGWDLARATGQPTAPLPEELAEQELAFTRAQLGNLPPDRRPFAPPQPVADDAPAVDRLAGCLGRSPTWTAGPG